MIQFGTNAPVPIPVQVGGLATNTQVPLAVQLGRLPAATALPPAGGASVAINTQAPLLLNFGQFPVDIFEHGNKTYVHSTQDPTQFQKLQAKKAQKRATARAKRERHSLMLEARALLKKSMVADIKGDVQVAQRLRMKATNTRMGAATICAPMTLHVEEVAAPTVERTEVELLEALEAVSSNLRRHM
jgi:hypothetical protein